jgi:hypothetical protein
MVFIEDIFALLWCKSPRNNSENLINTPQQAPGMREIEETQVEAKGWIIRKRRAMSSNPSIDD